MGALRSRWAVAIALATTFSMVTACGGDGGDSADPSAAEQQEGILTGSSAAEQNDSGTAAGDPSDANGVDDGLGGFECTITAEQVSEVFGVAVEQSEGACAFSPGAASGRSPSAAFLEQLSSLCEGDFLEQNGYTERIEGLGVDAFLKPSEANEAEIWVCAPAAFSVIVSVGEDLGRAGAVAAGETLALIALEG